MLHTTPSCALMHLVVLMCLCTPQPCCQQPLLLQQATRVEVACWCKPQAQLAALQPACTQR